ncbi:hypothetical protein [Listeria innocua]|uniref:hypothetical protein n=1 Tax=Listeria innocua TaxID=1642 RepID=UPI0016290587|nr:hypothetical protein [Listeria innocua]MBC1925568.1 hypothetical protein [Listeria innocua]
MTKRTVYKSIKIFGGLALFASFLFLSNSTAHADIVSSVNKATKEGFDLVKAICVGCAVLFSGAAWLVNMIPVQEINSKAKMVIFRVMLSLVGISITIFICDFFWKIGQ